MIGCRTRLGGRKSGPQPRPRPALRRSYAIQKNGSKYGQWLATDPNARELGNWERFMMRHWKGGKYFPFQTFPIETSKVWPEQLSQVLTPANAALHLPDEFSKNPANLVIASQKRVLVQSRTESWVKPFIAEFPDVPIYDVTIKQNYLHDLIKPITKHLWMRSAIANRELFVTTANRPDLSFQKLGLDVELSWVQYVFLVDSFSRVRARGVSIALPTEVASLISATKALISPAGIRQSHQNAQRAWAFGFKL